MTQEIKEGREEITKIQAALLQNELTNSQSLAEEFRMIVRHMQVVYDAALASHAPSDQLWNQGNILGWLQERSFPKEYAQRAYDAGRNTLAQPSEAAAQPILQMPANRLCNKCGWVHATGSECPHPAAVFQAEIEHNDH